jgi:hypothetical protein
MAGKNVVDIAQAVKLAAKYIASPGAVFDALEPVLKDGRIMLGEAADLADQGRLKFATVVRAQQAETRVNEAIKTGRLLGKNRAIGLKLALCFSDAFATLVEAGKPVVDLRTLGHAGAGEDQPVTAQQEMMTEVNAYVKEHNCSAAVALSEVTKKNPGLWTRYNAEIVVVSGPGAEEEE